MPVQKITELTPHKKRLIAMKCDGLTHEEIAAKLHVTKRTLDLQIYQIYEFLDVKNVAQLIKKAVALGIYTYYVEASTVQQLSPLTNCPHCGRLPGDATGVSE